MFPIWTYVTISMLTCLNFDPTSAQNGFIGPLTRVHEGENVTLQWNIISESVVSLNLRDEPLVVFSFKVGTVQSHARDRIEPAGNGINTFGLTILNVNLLDAGLYQCKSEGSTLGTILLFVWGKPEKAQVLQKKSTLACDVKLTSEPAESRSSIMYRWFRDNTRLRTSNVGFALEKRFKDTRYRCSAREINSNQWSEWSDYFKPNFDALTGLPVDRQRSTTTHPSYTTDNTEGTNTVLSLDRGYRIIIFLVSFASLLLIAVVIAAVILCRRKNATKVKNNSAFDPKSSLDDGVQESSEEDNTEFVDNPEYSDSYYESNSALGEYSDIREIDRLKIKEKAEDKRAEFITDIYAVPMKKSGKY